jgi:hypothetical protein
MPKDGWRKPYPTIEPEGRGVRAIAWPSPRSTCENTRVLSLPFGPVLREPDLAAPA